MTGFSSPNKATHLLAYLKPTFFIDCDAELVRGKALELTRNTKPVTGKAKALFYFVRDEIRYNPFSPRSSPEQFQASYTLSKGEGYCVQKAILLVALARAAEIPARLGFAKIRNHLISKKLLKIRKTNIFPWHGYAILYIGRRWVKATPMFDLKLCQEHQIIPVEFDGEHDAMLHPYTSDGRPHIEYLLDCGPYEDVPLDEIQKASILTKKLGGQI